MKAPFGRVNRRRFLRAGARGMAAAWLANWPWQALLAQPAQPPASADWDAGGVRHLLPTVSDTRMLIKASFTRPLANPPLLTVAGEGGGRRVEGLMNDSDGLFWQFHVEDLAISALTLSGDPAFSIDKQPAADDDGDVTIEPLGDEEDQGLDPVIVSIEFKPTLASTVAGVIAARRARFTSYADRRSNLPTTTPPHAAHNDTTSRTAHPTSTGSGRAALASAIDRPTPTASRSKYAHSVRSGGMMCPTTASGSYTTAPPAARIASITTTSSPASRFVPVRPSASSNAPARSSALRRKARFSPNSRSPGRTTRRSSPRSTSESCRGAAQLRCEAAPRPTLRS